MKIEVGKMYRTVSGANVEIVKDDNTDRWPMKGETEFGELWFSREGIFILGEKGDGFEIVEEIAPLPDAPGIFDEAQAAMQQRLAEPNDHPANSYVRMSADGERKEYVPAAEIETPTDRAIRSLRRSAIYQAVATCLIAIAVIIFGMRTANARDLLWMPNDAGGEIVLTDDMDGCGTARVVFARAAGGRTLMGCWAYTESGYVVARFGSDVRTWHLEDFKPFQSVPARGTRL